MLALCAVLSFGMAVDARAAWSDLWPFGKKTVVEPVPDPVPYVVTFTVVDADRKLEKALKQASGLVENQKTPTSGMVGLIARARQDIPRLTAVLYENARYAGEVEITIAGRPLEAIGPFDSPGPTPVPVTIRVRVGETFTFGAVDAAPLPEGVTLENLGLVPGKPAKASTILAAETKIADGWRQQGHPLVKTGARDTVADHRARTLSVRLAVDPGPVANFGRVSVTGTERVNPVLVSRRAAIDGGLYSSVVTRRAETRLRDLGVFESVQVVAADHLDAGRHHSDHDHRQRAQAACDRHQHQLFQHRGARRRDLLARPKSLRRRGAARTPGFGFPPARGRIRPRLPAGRQLPQAGGPRRDDRLHLQRRRLPRDQRGLPRNGARGRGRSLAHLLRYAERLGGARGVAFADAQRRRHGRPSADDVHRQARMGFARQPARSDERDSCPRVGRAVLRFHPERRLRDVPRRHLGLSRVRARRTGSSSPAGWRRRSSR